jgi:parallel beta-helix repeat protein
MKRMEFTAFFTALLLAGGSLLLIGQMVDHGIFQEADGKVLNVPGSYSTIQGAINAASSGDTVLVANGTYTETLSISKDIVLKGNSTNFVKIISFGSGDILTVTSNDVVITKMTLEHRGLLGKGSCIRISGSDNVTVNSVKTFSATDSGLFLKDSHNCEIFDVESWNNTNGVTVYNGDGNKVYMCHIHDNSETGIVLEDGSDNNTIYDTHLKTNYWQGILSIIQHTHQTGNVIRNCSMNFSRNAAILIGGNNSEWVIEENRINGTDGIYTLNSTDIKIRSNELTNISFEGVFIDSSSRSEISSNSISGANTGCTIWSTDNLEFRDNQMEGSGTGIDVLGPNCFNVNILRNELEGFNGAVDIFFNSGAINITGNSVLNASRGVLVDRASGVKVTGNDFINYTNRAIHLNKADGCQIVENGFHSRNETNVVAIYNLYSNFTLIRNNTFGVNNLGILSWGVLAHDLEISENLFDGSYQGLLVDDYESVEINGNTLMNYNGGIYIDGCRGVDVIENRLLESHEGIIVQESENVELRGNNLSDCFYGIKIDNVTAGIMDMNIVVESIRGVEIRDSRNLIMLMNEIRGGYIPLLTSNLADSIINQNTIADGQWQGLYMIGSSGPSFLDVMSNSFSGNNVGIYVMNGSGVVFNDNLIEGSSDYAMNLGSGTSGIQIDHNRFIDNNPGGAQATDDGTGNSWNSPWPDGGNYWSDYEGRDIYKGPLQDQPGMDGLGDDPHPLNGTSGSLDLYPLVNPSGAYPSGNIMITSHVNGEHVSGIELVEAAVTVPLFNSVIWIMNGNVVGVDTEYPYQIIIDTNPFPDGTSIDLVAEVDIPGKDNMIDRIEVIVSNDVMFGPFVDLNTGELIYHPDQTATANIHTNILTPHSKEVGISLRLDSPDGEVLFISDDMYIMTDHWSLTFPVPSDAVVGEWVVNVTVMGYSGSHMIWSSHVMSEFLVTGENTHDMIQSLREDLSILDLQNASINLLLEMIGEMGDDLDQMNGSLHLHLREILAGLISLEINITERLEGMNTSMRALIDSRIDEMMVVIQTMAEELNLNLSMITGDIDSILEKLDQCCNMTAAMIMELNSSINQRMDEMEFDISATMESCCNTLQGLFPYLEGLDSNLTSLNLELISRLDDMETMISDLSNMTIDEIRGGVEELMDYLIGLNTSEAGRHAALLSGILDELEDLNESISENLEIVEEELAALSQIADLVEEMGNLEAEMESTQTDVEDGNDQNTMLLIAIIIAVIVAIILLVVLLVRAGKEYEELEEA